MHRPYPASCLEGQEPLQGLLPAALGQRITEDTEDKCEEEP